MTEILFLTLTFAACVCVVALPIWVLDTLDQLHFFGDEIIVSEWECKP